MDSICKNMAIVTAELDELTQSGAFNVPGVSFFYQSLMIVLIFFVSWSIHHQIPKSKNCVSSIELANLWNEITLSCVKFITVYAMQAGARFATQKRHFFQQVSGSPQWCFIHAPNWMAYVDVVP